MKSTALLLTALTMTAAATTAFAAESKPKTAAAHSPESIECTKQADAKKLHGAERKKFRAECKKEMKTKAAPVTTKTTPPPAVKPKAETQPSK
jgi:hypothetical protein